MAGDGGVLKRRLRPGRGEFPVDCPLHDTTVRIHYRARPLPPSGSAAAGAGGAGWAFDTRRRAGAAGGGSGEGGGEEKEDGEGAPPLEVDTGCGELPEALELCARLMVPGELARAAAQPRYAYQARRRPGEGGKGPAGRAGASCCRRARRSGRRCGGRGCRRGPSGGPAPSGPSEVIQRGRRRRRGPRRAAARPSLRAPRAPRAPPNSIPSPPLPIPCARARRDRQGRADAPAGLRPDEAVEFEIELIDFHREGHWQALPWPERWALLERLRARGNALYRDGKFRYAANRRADARRRGRAQGGARARWVQGGGRAAMRSLETASLDTPQRARARAR
jgi:hypothetical protein